MKIILKLLMLSFALQSCENKTSESKQKVTIQDTLKSTSIKADENQIKEKTPKIFTDPFEFVYYNDNGDYRWLYAKKGKDTYSFVNDNNDQRNLRRGDICEIKWKKDTIYIAGDGETPQIEDWLIAIKKTQDGKVSKFRKEYKKELKYHYSDDIYSKSGLDDLYVLAEFYIANSKNKLIQSAIQKKEQLEYSIESRTENNKYYQVLGIGYTFEHRFTIMQWIYIDIETQKIYEYDIANEKLIEFK
ncbi:hypothetical protein [Kaistella antarctica]|uniref:Uncharacterized protein n=1 Tax=Kaistella antarctica TaxID=266748 RepID=A0A448NRJ5_9FLAO|nr:hypothetical protein [Kaistella antarctica]KEY18746.1 hypothetical protein HY04_09725 [Kaistella antarctica]SEW15921.1 hypothetical protein SAMN05421765_2788 [Kaistella antarctica]VEH99598.1 Uncharacterised protein [Kaistella antarctica]